jgi:hypothetical protein
VVEQAQTSINVIVDQASDGACMLVVIDDQVACLSGDGANASLRFVKFDIPVRGYAVAPFHVQPSIGVDAIFVCAESVLFIAFPFAFFAEIMFPKFVFLVIVEIG